MDGELRLALPDEYKTAPPASPQPSAPDAGPAVPNLTLAPITDTPHGSADHARHEYQHDTHDIEILPAHNTVEPPAGPQPEPVPHPRPWLHRDVAEIARIDVGEAIRKAIPARPVIKVAPDELADLIAKSEHGPGSLTFAGITLERESEFAGFAVVGGSDELHAVVIGDLIGQVRDAHRQLIVCEPRGPFYRRHFRAEHDAVCEPDSHGSLAVRIALSDEGGTLFLPAGPGAAAHLSDALAARMSARHAAPLWVVIPGIERLDPIADLRRIVEFGWTRGIVLVFTVSDWARFEALYGSFRAAYLVGERQHKLILRTPDAHASHWAEDLLGGVASAEIRALSDGRAFFRHAGAYPATEIAIAVPLLEAA